MKITITIKLNELNSMILALNKISTISVFKLTESQKSAWYIYKEVKLIFKKIQKKRIKTHRNEKINLHLKYYQAYVLSEMLLNSILFMHDAFLKKVCLNIAKTIKTKL